VLVDGASAERGPDVVADEFFTQVFNCGAGGPGGEGFFAGAFEVFLLRSLTEAELDEELQNTIRGEMFRQLIEAELTRAPIKFLK